MRRFRLLEPEDEEAEEGEDRPGRSMKEWLKLLIWTLIWGG